MTSNTKMNGIIKVNGVEVTNEERNNYSAYVSHDLFIQNLTVYEHLKFLVIVYQVKTFSY